MEARGTDDAQVGTDWVSAGDPHPVGSYLSTNSSAANVDSSLYFQMHYQSLHIDPSYKRRVVTHNRRDVTRGMQLGVIQMVAQKYM